MDRLDVIRARGTNLTKALSSIDSILTLDIDSRGEDNEPVGKNSVPREKDGD